MIERDLELTLHDLAEVHVRDKAPADVREDARLVPLTTSQRRSWLPRHTGRLQSMFSATKFVVAGAAVLTVSFTICGQEICNFSASDAHGQVLHFIQTSVSPWLWDRDRFCVERGGMHVQRDAIFRHRMLKCTQSHPGGQRSPERLAEDSGSRIDRIKRRVTRARKVP